jgi:hypothetical protein
MEPQMPSLSQVDENTDGVVLDVPEGKFYIEGIN